MDLVVIVPFYNGNEFLRGLLDSIPNQLKVILVVDAGSEQPSYTTANTEILNLNKRGYFSGAVNAGIQATSTNVLVVNQDVRFESNDWLRQLEKLPENIAIAGEGVMQHPAWPKGYVQGTFMFLRRTAINDVGLLDEENYPLWGATCEWQLRAVRAGYKARPMKYVKGFKHLRYHKRFGSAIQKTLRDTRRTDQSSWLIRTPPMVSVIIPCYNYGRYLQDAVNSLVGGWTSLGHLPQQTFASFEVIIVDDASTDDSVQLAEKLVDPWRGIRLIRRKENGGTPAANNTGIWHAFGKYVTILCADDMMESNRLEYMVRALEQNPGMVAYDNLQTFTNGERTKVWTMREYNFDELLYKNQMHAGIMFERTAWEKIGGYPEIMKDGREDWAVNIALGMFGYCGLHLKEAGYLYRREKQNRTLINTNPAWRKTFMAQLGMTFPRLYSGERPMGCCGSGRGSARKASAMRTKNAAVKAAPLKFVGENGMILVKYIGKSAGTISFYGAKTGARYVVSTKKNTIFVDEADARTNSPSRPGLLELREYGAQLFKVVDQGPSKVESQVFDKAGVVAKKKPQPLPEEEIEKLEAVTVLDAALEDTTLETESILDAAIAEGTRLAKKKAAKKGKKAEEIPPPVMEEEEPLPPLESDEDQADLDDATV